MLLAYIRFNKLVDNYEGSEYEKVTAAMRMFPGARSGGVFGSTKLTANVFLLCANCGGGVNLLTEILSFL